MTFSEKLAEYAKQDAPKDVPAGITEATALVEVQFPYAWGVAREAGPES